MTIKVIYRTGISYKNGMSPLFLRFSHKKQTKLVSLGISIPPIYWDSEAQKLTPDCPERETLITRINVQIEAYNKQVRRLEALDIEPTIDNLFQTKHKTANHTLAEILAREVEYLESLGKCTSANKYRNVKSLLFRAGKETIRLEDVDLAFLKDFESYLRQRGNNGNSIATKFTVLKAAYNKALNEGLFEPKTNPFKQFKVGGFWTDTRKRAITKDDVQKIVELNVPDSHKNRYRRLAKDIFLFSYFTAGINFCDISTLRHKDIVNGRVFYSRHKTGKLLSCKLSDYSKEIVAHYSGKANYEDDYIFPILSRGLHETDLQKHNRMHKALSNINYNLREIGKEIGLSFPLTTYVARHTFATVLKRSGVNVALISEALGHSDIATTQIYLDSFENEQLDEAMGNLL